MSKSQVSLLGLISAMESNSTRPAPPGSGPASTSFVCVRMDQTDISLVVTFHGMSFLCPAIPYISHATPRIVHANERG